MTRSVSVTRGAMPDIMSAISPTASERHGASSDSVMPPVPFAATTMSRWASHPLKRPSRSYASTVSSTPTGSGRKSETRHTLSYDHHSHNLSPGWSCPLLPDAPMAPTLHGDSRRDPQPMPVYSAPAGVPSAVHHPLYGRNNDHRLAVHGR